MHIGHLVPLERSNFAMLLRSSGVVRASENPLKIVCENANTHAHDVVHLLVLAHLQRRSCWSWFGSTQRRKWSFMCMVSGTDQGGRWYRP